MNKTLEYKMTLEYEKFIKGIENSLKHLEKFGENFKKVQGYASNFALSLKAQFEKVQNAMRGLANGINSLHNVARKAFLSIVALNSIPIKLFANFQEQIDKIMTISSQSREKIENDIKNIAKATGTTTGVLSEAYYQTVSAIGDVSEATEFLTVANKNAIAGFTDTTSSVDALSSILNAYGLEVSKVNEISDLMISTQNLGKTTVAELAQSYYNVIPTAASLGVSFEQVSAAMATITAQGTPTRVATTQLRSVFVELSKAGSGASETFNKIIGTTFTNFIAKGGNINEALELMRAYAEKNNLSLRDMFSTVEAGNAALLLTGVGGKKFNDTLLAMEESVGATDIAFDKLSNSINRRFKKSVESMKIQAIEFGETWNTELLDLFNRFDSLLESFNTWLSVNKEAIKDISLFALKVSGLALAFLSLAKAIMWLSTPLGLATASIVALAAAWYLNFGGIREQLEKLLNFIKENPILSGILGFSALIIPKLLISYAFGLVGAGLKSLMAIEITKAGLTLGAGLKLGIAGAAKTGLALLGGFAVGVGLVILEDNGINNVKDYLDVIKNTIKDTVEMWKDGEIAEIFKALFITIGDLAIDLILPQNVQDAFMNFLDKIDEKVKKMQERAKNGTMIIPSYLTGEGDKTISEINKGYSVGGYTGHGGKYDVAGVVHKGEYVIPAWMVQSNPMMIASLEKERRGYSSGGYVDSNLNYLNSSNINNQYVVELLRNLANYSQDTVNYQNLVDLFNSLDKSISNFEKNVEELEKEIKENVNGGSGSSNNETKSIEFSQNLSMLSSELANFANALESESLKVVSSLTSLGSSLFNSINLIEKNGLSSLSGFTGALGVAGAVISAYGLVNNYLDKENDLKNQEQMEIYQKNTEELIKIGEILENQTEIINDLSISLVASLSKNPTIYRTQEMNKVYDNMIKDLENNKSFGKINFVADYKKDRLFSSDKHKQKTFSYGADIDNYSYEELKKYRESLNNLNNSTFAAIAQGQKVSWDSSDWGDMLLDGIMTGWTSLLFSDGYDFNGITSSNLEEYKKNIDMYLENYEKLVKEQQELTRKATLESFQGIEILEEEKLREQYRKLYEDMGMNPDDHKESIEQMIKANQVLVTATQEVRSGFIQAFADGAKAGEAMIKSLEGYFNSMFQNISSVIYDVLFSDFDRIATEYFQNFSEMLVKAKESGMDLESTVLEYLKGSDTQELAKMLLEIQESNISIEEFKKELIKTLKAQGITDETLEMMGLRESSTSAGNNNNDSYNAAQEAHAQEKSATIIQYVFAPSIEGVVMSDRELDSVMETKFYPSFKRVVDKKESDRIGGGTDGF